MYIRKDDLVASTKGTLFGRLERISKALSVNITPDFYKRKINISPQQSSATHQEQGRRATEAKSRVIDLLNEIKCVTHKMQSENMALFKRCGLKEEIE